MSNLNLKYRLQDDLFGEYYLWNKHYNLCKSSSKYKTTRGGAIHCYVVLYQYERQGKTRSTEYHHVIQAHTDLSGVVEGCNVNLK